MVSTALLVAVSLTIVSATLAKVPDYIHLCSVSDPEIDKCIIESVEFLKPYLARGIPELDIPSIEPLELGNIHLSIGEGGNNVQTNATNLKVWGPKDFEILELKTKMSANRFWYRFKIFIPKLIVVGRYEINARILFLNLVGNGPIQINATGINAECVLDGKRTRVENDDYVLFKPIECVFRASNATIYLDDLFRGNPEIGRATNDIINEHVFVFLDEIRPELMKAISELFTSMANKITLNFKISELFLP